MKINTTPETTAETEIIDIHTHAFPDQVAAKAIPALEKEGNVKAYHDGRISSLLVSMDRAGIARSVLCSIATRPSQFEPILDWSIAIRSERIIPFPSCHPSDVQVLDQISQIRKEGFFGIKMHPYYQDFFIAEERMLPIYERICREGLVLLMHTGFDIAFPRTRRADPAAISQVLGKFPQLKLIATHLGAWDDWDEVERHLLGREVYMDIAFVLDYLSRERALEFLNRHPRQYLLFGTDSPWADQKAAVAQLKDLGLGAARQQAMLADNARRLLGI